MAEVVEFRIEKGIDELLELERAGLFTSHEIKIVIKKRKEMEYRLQRKKKSKENYMKYISYEESLLQLVKIRRQKIRFFGRYKEIERSIATRVAGLYKKVVDRNQSDLQLWLSYIEFCRKQKWKGTVSSLFAKMLQVHSKKEEIWVLAARWESQYNSSIDTGRSLMHRGLRFNPNSRTMFREYFSLELQYAVRIIKRQEILKKGDESDIGEGADERNDAITSGAVAAVVYETAVQRISDPAFAIQLIGCLREYSTSFKETLEVKLIEDLKNRFPDSEEVLQLLCEREIETVSPEEALSVTRQLYGDAVQRKATEKMWNFFLSSLLRLLAADQQSFRRKQIIHVLSSSFEDAFQNDCLSIAMFSEWVLLYKALILGSSKRKDTLRKALEDILVRVTNKWRGHPAMWSISLSVRIETSDSNHGEVNRFFQRGLERLSAYFNSHDVVLEEDIVAIENYIDIYVKWATTNEKVATKTVLNILDSCCDGKVFTVAKSCGRSLISYFQTLILKVANEVESFESAQRFYLKYKDRQPINPSLFLTMLDLSKSAGHNAIVQVYEDYLNEFGSNDHRIWMDYVKYSIAHAAVTAAPEIHDRAVRMLSPSEQALFLAAYSFFMANL